MWENSTDYILIQRGCSNKEHKGKLRGRHPISYEFIGWTIATLLVEPK